MALLLAGSGFALFLRAPHEITPAARLLGDSSGRIELAVVSVNSARRSSLRNAALVSSIINHLPERARILILASDREAFSIASNPWPERIRFVDMPADFALTIWPQDPFLVLRGEHGSRLLASPEFKRADDREMARILSDFLGLPLEYSMLAFEGGNIVADESHVFIGANTIRYNAIRLNLPEAEIGRRFQDQLGKAVIVVGPAPQPIGHIDMMLTPLGDRRLLLADPGWGARLARLDLEQDPGAVRAFENGSEDNFFGLAGVTELPARDGGTIRAPEIVGASRAAVEDSSNIAAAIDRLGESLAALGFEIHRIPFLYRVALQPQPLAAGETIPPGPGYPQMTYNNVLLEADGAVRTVYLPQYGWPRLDRAAAAAWQQLGYRVITIPGFTTTAMYGGALRCSVKVLSRS